LILADLVASGTI